ncbi:MAG: hypothetical protein M0Z89_11030 [Nitrospiraceae bacterium]|nr:hypothetical protein [Nitrospiraceae bacterium]
MALEDDATLSMNGGVNPVVSIVKEPFAPVVPLAVFPVLSTKLTAALAIGLPVAAVPLNFMLLGPLLLALLLPPPPPEHAESNATEKKTPSATFKLFISIPPVI